MKLTRLTLCLYCVLCILNPSYANATTQSDTGSLPKVISKKTNKDATNNKDNLAVSKEQGNQTLENTIETGLDEKIVLKKITKPTLKTVLPFNSFCGTKLSIVPPNNQLVTEFAQKAAIESFTYDYKQKKDQWFELEKCFSELGWQSFESAVSRSGNNQSVTDEKLFVSAKIDGKAEMLASNLIAPSWKVLIPLIVRYENETHYLDQHLKVKVVISIENQKLSIDQVIASPALEKHKYERSLDTFKTEKS